MTFHHHASELERKARAVPRIFVEYVDGGTLHEWLYGKTQRNEDGTETVVEKPRELTRAQRLGIAIEICRGMQHAHSFEWTGRKGTKRVGLVHRDLKPLNILMTADGVPRVTDFGLVGFSKVPGGQPEGGTAPAIAGPEGDGLEDTAQSERTLVKPRAGALDSGACEGATQSPLLGGVPGTPAYTPPEQWDPHAVTTKSADVYAFGVIVYELFCGRRPLELPEEYRHAKAGVISALFEELHREQEPPDPASLVPEIDSELSALMLHCLEKDPKARPDSFRQINDRIKSIYERLEGESYDDLRPQLMAPKLLAGSLNNRALSYLEIAQPKRAEQLWDEALTADPHHPESTYNRGLQLWRSGRMTDDELVRQLEEVRTTHGDDWRDDYLLGLVHIERGDYGRAVELLEEASAQTPHNTDVQAALRTSQTHVDNDVKSAGPLRAYTGDVARIALSLDGTRLLAWGRSMYIHPVKHTCTNDPIAERILAELGEARQGFFALWDVRMGTRVQTFNTNDIPLGLSYAGGSAVSQSRDGTLTFWDTTTGTRLRAVEIATRPERWLALSTDLASACRWAETSRSVCGISSLVSVYRCARAIRWKCSQQHFPRIHASRYQRVGILILLAPFTLRSVTLSKRIF